ncbi:MAG: tetratricopeptide repeat protein [Desulfobulbaceae bacterium]|uniref:Tetratricopeptide repeat protein n=1 Tax=Candidatus Desulfobia pelagia TaxID=2841692 RepID=A0A8J6TFA8_9BACT|nr:tetratricopeptide repeat protein [Candidatus Desulfobia pelagia]
MTENEQLEKETAEEKSQARLDYEAGQNHLQKDDISQAANMFHNALIGFEQDGDEHGVANASDKLGDICAGREDFDGALNHYERAYTICTKDSDRFSLFSLEKKKAHVMFQAKRYQEAVTLYLDVIDEYEALRNPQGTVDTLDILANIYIEMGDKEKAADSYRLAASIHKNYKHKRHAEALLKKAEEVLIS